jgi:hypothetical protein
MDITVTIIALLLLLAYGVNVIFVMKRGSLVLSMWFMTLCWTFIPFVGFLLVKDTAFLEANAAVSGLTFMEVVKAVFQTGPETWGATLQNYLFGAFFGAVMIKTNIASTIIRKTVELGGDRPGITASLVSIVLCLISTSVYGTGAMIAMGVIVIPILLALGISKFLAVFLFIFSNVAGLWINPALIRGYFDRVSSVQGYADYTFQSYLPAGMIGLIITLIITVIAINIYVKKDSTAHAWAVQRSQPEIAKNAPGIALITPVIPVLLVAFLNFPVFPAYIIAGSYAFIVCGNFKTIKSTASSVTEAFANGMVDTAPMFAFLIGISIFNKTTQFAQPFLAPLLSPVLPKNIWVLGIIFIALAFLSLFRGPFTLAGAGMATAAIIATAGFQMPQLFPILMAPTMIGTFCCCVTQSWTSWALVYAKEEPREYLRRAFLPTGWIIIAVLIIAFLIYGSAI